MNKALNALLIFCEGDHDVAYVRTIFRKLQGYNRAKLKFSEMPYPFNILFERTIKKHIADDMSLDMVHKFFLPDEILQKGGCFVLIFKVDGETKYEKIRTLLSGYLQLFNSDASFSEKESDYITAYKYLFLYDADADGVDNKGKALAIELQKIGEFDFINRPWEDSCSPFGKISYNKAMYVWGETIEKGTLEDILLPIIELEAKSKIVINKAKQAMSDMFEWDFEKPKQSEQIAEKARYNKSVITTAGQGKKPGRSLGVVIREAELITKDVLELSPRTKDFMDFLKEFLEI